MFALFAAGALSSASGQIPKDLPGIPPSPAPDTVPVTRPLIAYPFLRFDEDWSGFCGSIDTTHPGVAARLKCLHFRDPQKSYATLSAEIKEVYEVYDNQYWGAGPQDKGGWFLQRYLLGADWHMSSTWRLFSEMQASLENGRNGGPRPYDVDKPDVHQFFVDYTHHGNADATVRVGRQELQYGSGRLVEVRFGLNTRISFDGVKAILKRPGFRVDAFATRPTLQRSGFLNDTPDSKQLFWGTYATAGLPKGTSVDAYYLGLNHSQQTFARGTSHYLVHTIGSRFARRASRWDLDEEAILQLGKFGKDDIRAWSISGTQGYTFASVRLQPRLSLSSDITSGDHHPNGGSFGTFFPLFPRGKYFGEADLNGPLNTYSLIAVISVHPGKTVTLAPGYGAFWRQSRNDGVYGYAGNLYFAAATDAGRFIGQQTEVDVTWALAPNTVLRAVYQHFFSTDLIATRTPGKNVNYGTVWLDYHF